jgi:hypothetical protein
MRVFAIDGVADQYETLSTLTTAKGFTAAKYQPTSGDFIGKRARMVIISCETGDVRFTFDGTTPTTLALGGDGHLLMIGASYEIRGEQNVANFKCINDVNANGATLHATFLF